MATIHKENGGLLKYTIASPVSTGVDYNNINSLIENRQKRDGNVGTSRYSIGPQPEYAFPPKGNFPGITKEVNDIMLDAVTGSSSALKLLRPAVGRVVTNLVRPASYSVQDKINIIKNVYKKDGIKGLLKSVIKDEPIYSDENLFGTLVPKAQSLPTSREVPYRMMFDLPPRYGKSAYSNIDNLIKRDKSGSFDIVNEMSFNPNTVMGVKNLRNVVEEVEFPMQPGARSHITLGDFLAKRRRDLPSGEVTGLDYEDVWNMGINKGELGKIWKAFTSGKESKKDLLSSVILRKLADSITNPVTIKGTVPKNIYDDVVKKGVEGRF